jgi:hypothetical protein
MPTTINVEPNWENMFEVSIAIVNSVQKTPKGQKDLILPIKSSTSYQSSNILTIGLGSRLSIG